VAIRLVLADDHPILLDGLTSLFGPPGDFVVAALVRDGEETLRALREHAPDVLVLDLRMPRLDGLGVLRAMREEGLATRVVVLTAEAEDDDIVEALRLGVRGVVLKEMAPEMLLRAVRRVHEGGTWLERVSAGRALERLSRREEARGEAPALTARELEVARFVAEGLRNREIAERLGIGEGTVKIHRHHAYEKLGVESRLALAVRLRRRGLL
jgi:DNA-binding NarL/FixJ family response regulator